MEKLNLRDSRNLLPGFSAILRLALCLLGTLLLITTAAWARPTTPEQAGAVVQNWLALEARPLNADLGAQVWEVRTFTDDAGAPVYYVVQLQPAGLVFVPADDLVEPIAGFLPGGSYDPSPDNPLGALVSRDLTGRVLRARALEAKALEQAAPPAPQGKEAAAQKKWDLLARAADRKAVEMYLPALPDVRVAPLLQTAWSQGDAGGQHCYNYYTAFHYPCGCTATAMAQLMRFHRHPATGVGMGSFTVTVDKLPESAMTRGGDGGGGPYHWEQMPLSPGAATPLSQIEAIGALTYDAGLSVNTDYASAGSGALPEKVAKALKEVFAYGNAVTGWNGDNDIPGANLLLMINPNLDAGLPVLLAIWGPVPGGHAIVADGYGFNLNSPYHHLNMGWSGQCNVWYNLPDIDSNNAKPNAAGPFTQVFACTYNIFPSGAGEIISGRVLDDAGQPVKGAMVTANGALITATNAQGIYAFTNLNSNTDYQISVTVPGQAVQTQTVTTGASTEMSTTAGNVWGVDFPPADETPKWRYPNLSSPLLGLDGTIYGVDNNQGLCALTPDGALKWRYQGEWSGAEPLAIGPDGTIFVKVYQPNTSTWFAINNHYLYAFTPGGALKWQCRPTFWSFPPDYLGKILWGSEITELAIGGDGSIYLCGSRAYFPGITQPGILGTALYALSSNGVLKWIYPESDQSLDGHWSANMGLPTIGPDGTIYISAAVPLYGYPFYWHISALSASGGLQWRYPQISAEYAFGADGSLLGRIGEDLGNGNWNQYFCAFNTDGSLKWQTNWGVFLDIRPVVAADGTIYVYDGGGDSYDHGYLCALTAGGALKWRSDRDKYYGSPTLGKDGTIYVYDGTDHTKLCALTADGALKWRSTRSYWGNPLIGNDGTIYINGNGYPIYLYALNSSCGGLADSSWPMAQHDPQKTCRATYPGPPAAAFNANPTSGHAPLTVQFTDASTGAFAWAWNFGDGGSSAAKNPSHTYNNPGAYTVTLTVTGFGGSSSKSRTVTATVPPPPVADFTADAIMAMDPLTLQFMDASTGAVTSWTWDFGDGGASAIKNPSHSYQNPGKYTVKLMVSNAGGSNSKTKLITAGVVADFSAAPGSGPAPLSVQFTDASSGEINSRVWDFGDGSGSSAASPSHIYEQPGTYTATLKVYGPVGNSHSKSATITVTPAAPVANFTANTYSGPAPLTVQFTDASSGNITSRVWDFGDGSGATATSPSHLYSSAGTYTATLTVTGPGGSHSKSAVIISTVPNLLGIATDRSEVAVPRGGTATFQVKLTSQPGANKVVTAARVRGIPEISIVAGGKLTFTPANWNTYQTVKLAATADNNNPNGQAAIRLSAPGLTSMEVTAIKGGTDPTPILELLLTDEDNKF